MLFVGASWRWKKIYYLDFGIVILWEVYFAEPKKNSVLDDFVLLILVSFNYNDYSPRFEFLSRNLTSERLSLGSRPLDGKIREADTHEE